MLDNPPNPDRALVIEKSSEDYDDDSPDAPQDSPLIRRMVEKQLERQEKSQGRRNRSGPDLDSEPDARKQESVEDYDDLVRRGLQELAKVGKPDDVNNPINKSANVRRFVEVGE